MAKQNGQYPFSGKLGPTVGYMRGGKHCLRGNGALTGKQFRNDRRFRRTMEFAAMFAQASKVVVLIYKALPKDQRKHGVYGKLTGKAMSMLKNEKTVEEVKEILIKQYVEGGEKLVVESPETGVQSQELAGTTPLHLSTQHTDARCVKNDQYIHEPESGRNGQRQVMATIVRPYFYSTMSV